VVTEAETEAHAETICRIVDRAVLAPVLKAAVRVASAHKLEMPTRPLSTRAALLERRGWQHLQVIAARAGLQNDLLSTVLRPAKTRLVPELRPQAILVLVHLARRRTAKHVRDEYARLGTQARDDAP